MAVRTFLLLNENGEPGGFVPIPLSNQVLVETAMGLRGDLKMFLDIKAAVSRGIRKLGFGPQNHANLNSQRSNAMRGESRGSFLRLAWLPEVYWQQLEGKPSFPLPRLWSGLSLYYRM
ncbi:hypothetical protein BKA70DRAFT_1220282 [Coprinopsis sp. MPI-PUGE-AT-0042]|nr:hypothetical protein BKA70DRAFT_1220282 [Coprinopsis sp. MPI-PUGE-AT-0042]